MKSSNDNYNFSQDPPDRSPGFVFFPGGEDDYFYFYFNDLNGKTLLYSEGYLTEKSRNIGHRSVLKNGSIEKRYTFLEHEEKYFFILKAGNHKEIARSRLYDSFESANEDQEWLITNINRKVADFEVPKMSSSRSINTSKTINKTMEPVNEIQPLKYHFRIDLYPDVEAALMKGKIANVLTNAKKSFTGLDQELIFNFIKSNVSKQDRASLFVKTKSNNVNTSKSNDNTSGVNFWKGQKQADNIKLLLTRKEQSKHSKHLAQNAFFEIIVQPTEEIGNRFKTGENVELKLWIKSVGDDSYMNQWKMAVPIENETAVKLPRSFNIQEPGIYHLRAYAESKEAAPLMGSTMVHVY